jgi:glycerol-3-phosphate dehydrogenase (NAD(P)+)
MGIENIGIVGGGAWGTALAASAARAGKSVHLWALEEAVAQEINTDHINNTYLPGIALDPTISASIDIGTMADRDAILLVSPAQHMRSVGSQVASVAQPGVPLVICSKGIEITTLELMSEILGEVAPKNPITVLSGPTFAAEVANNLPSAVTLACADPALGADLVDALGHSRFRPYLSDDVVGAQIGGAVKNVLAIAAGIVAGAKMGDNAAAALITRGLAEITRLGDFKGGRRETLMGLSGLGDLLLTCGSTQSRNMSLGKALGEGQTLDDIMASRNSVAEGVHTAKAVARLSAEQNIDMPICQAMDRILHHGASVNEEIEALLARPFVVETD